MIKILTYSIRIFIILMFFYIVTIFIENKIYIKDMKVETIMWLLGCWISCSLMFLVSKGK